MAYVESLLRQSGYSEKAIELYINKVNVGEIPESSICFAYTGHCGDTMEISLDVDADTIRDARFQAIGCAGAFASGSAVTEMVKQKTLKHAREIDQEQVLAYLEGLPEEKHDCALLAVRTLHKTLQAFEKNSNNVT